MSSLQALDAAGAPAAVPAGGANPVVVIPGVGGSRLVADADSAFVWGQWKAGFKDPGSEAGARLFALPMATGLPLDQLRSESHVDGTLGVVRGSVVGIPVEINAYGNLLSALGVESQTATFAADQRAAAVYQTPAFEFSYDWRRSLDESAIEFEAFLQRVTRFRQVQLQSLEPVRFDVVAHSMGGLLLRYFLRYGNQLLPHDGGLPRLTWAGAGYIDRAVILGAPNAGSLEMVDRLVRGIPGNPVHPPYGPVLLGTMPSGYLLLPRARHAPCADGPVDLLDPEFWLARDWGITASWLDAERAQQMPGIDSPTERRHTAEDHLRKCLHNARLFQAALDRRVEWLPAHLQMHLFYGDATRTPAQFTAEPGARGVTWTRHDAGDGVVLASSALLAEPDGPAPVPWASTCGSPNSHMSLMHDRELLRRIGALLSDR